MKTPRFVGKPRRAVALVARKVEVRVAPPRQRVSKRAPHTFRVTSQTGHSLGTTWSSSGLRSFARGACSPLRCIQPVATSQKMISHLEATTRSTFRPLSFFRFELFQDDISFGSHLRVGDNVAFSLEITGKFQLACVLFLKLLNRVFTEEAEHC
jgi:hypothetical protein